jgi:hypothetical protein
MLMHQRDIQASLKDYEWATGVGESKEVQITLYQK